MIGVTASTGVSIAHVVGTNDVTRNTLRGTGRFERSRVANEEWRSMKKAAIALMIVLGAGFAVLAAAATMLTITILSTNVECPDGNVTVEYTISSTSGQNAAVTETLTDDATKSTKASRSYNIVAGNNPGVGWTVGGKTKTHDDVFQTTGLLDGDYSLQICVVEAGTNGNPAKTVCQTAPIRVACAEQTVNPCASASPKGEVVGNDRITDHSTAEITFEGNFGQVASLEIKGPDNFYRSFTIPRKGDSCQYHANWKFTTGSGSDVYGNNGPGVYTVTVNGNNSDPLEFSFKLND
jgi:hypothetical protein